MLRPNKRLLIILGLAAALLSLANLATDWSSLAQGQAALKGQGHGNTGPGTPNPMNSPSTGNSPKTNPELSNIAGNKSQQQSFSDDVWKIIIDKLLIAAIIAGLGYWLNLKLEGFKTTLEKSVEQYKNTLALSNEIAKQRVSKCDEVWSALYALQAVIKEAYDKIQEISSNTSISESKKSKQYKEDIGPLLMRLPGLRDSAQALIEKNRFYLGDQLREKAMSYYRKIDTLLEVLPAKQFEEALSLFNQLDQESLDSDEVFKILIKGSP